MTSIPLNQSSTTGINKHTIYTDGGCHNESGPKMGIGSYAWLEPVDMMQGYVDVYGYYATNSTNNKTEMNAVIYGIGHIIKSDPDVNIVEIISDSGYLVKGFTDPAYLQKWIKRGWKLSTNEPVKNIDLWQELIKLSWKVGLEWVHIRGHNKDKNYTHAFWNDICDRACTHIMESFPTENMKFHLKYDFNTRKFELMDMEVGQ